VETKYESPMHLSVFDLTGRLVEILYEEKLFQGEYKITWDGGSYPSGVYIVHLHSGVSVNNQKVLLLK